MTLTKTIETAIKLSVKGFGSSTGSAYSETEALSVAQGKHSLPLRNYFRFYKIPAKSQRQVEILVVESLFALCVCVLVTHAWRLHVFLPNL